MDELDTNEIVTALVAGLVARDEILTDPGEYSTLAAVEAAERIVAEVLRRRPA